MLTKEAFNALLKTLEEPPEHVKFIFATTEPNKIPVTILSRCQRYDFAGIEAVAIQERLAQIAQAEGVEVETDALQILAMRAAGSMRDSQSLLEQLLSTGSDKITTDDVTSMLGVAPAARLSQLVRPLVEKNAALAIAELDAAIAEGAEVSQLIDQLLGYFRDVMTQSVGCDVSSMLYALPGQIEEIRAIADQLGVQTLLAIVQIFDQTAARMRVSTHTRTLAEMAIVRVCHLDNLDELATLIDQLKGTTASEAAPVKKNLAARAPVASPPRSQLSQTPVATSSPNATQPQPDTTTAATATAPPAQATAATEIVKLTAENVEQIWKQVLDSLSGMIADHAAEADEVSVDSQGRLVLNFSQGFHRDICEKPNNRSRLDAALQSICGQIPAIVFHTHTRTDAAQPRVTPRQSRRQQQAEVAAQPFVRKAMELFDGDPSRLRYQPTQ